MKNLIKLIFVLLLLVFANCIYAQNACEFDSSYEKTAQGHRLLETEDGNYFLVTLSGFDGGINYANKLILKLALIGKCGNEIWKKNIDSLGSGTARVIGFYKESDNVLICAVTNLVENNTMFYKIDNNGNRLHKWKYNATNFQTKNILKISDNKYITMGYLIQSNGSTSHNNPQIVMTDTLGNILATKKIYVDSNSKGQIFNGYKLTNNNILLLGSEDSSLRLTYIDTSLVITNNIKVKSSSYIGRLSEYILLSKDSSQILYTAPVYTNNFNSLKGFYLARFDLLGNILQEKNFFDIDRYGTGDRLHVFETNKVLFLKGSKNFISFIYLDSSFNIIKMDSIEYPPLTTDTYVRGARDYIFSNDNAVVFAGSIEFTSLMNYRTTVNVFKQSLFTKIKTIIISGTNFINQKNGILQLTTAIIPTNAANQNVIWSISDTNLATITQTGLVTAKANGTVIVTATAADGGGATASKTITISNQNIIVQQISIIGNDSIFTKNGFIQLSAAILPTNAANQQVIWSIKDTNLASITQAGLVTAKANGTVIVTATAADGGGATATKTITITNQSVGLNKVNLNNQIKIYPNPASNKLIITTTNNLTPDASGLQLQLLDLTGKVIANYNNQTEIDISAIANGMYLLHIQTPNGNLVKQVVVNK